VSADEVVDAVTAWFQPPAVEGLNLVLDAAPWFVDGANFQLDSELGWGAVGFVWVDSQEEQRIALGGAHGGLKWVKFQVSLAVIFQMVIPRDADLQAIATGYRRPLNAVLDGVVDRLRQDRTLGGAPGVFQAGEGDGTGSDDIMIVRELPKRDVGKVWSMNNIEFTVTQVVAS
jgi:hypothetical protein